MVSKFEGLTSLRATPFNVSSCSNLQNQKRALAHRNPETAKRRNQKLETRNGEAIET